ncbi:MAG TPA: hypothetical protein VGF71_00620 [Caulobacteraceae bacterium]
MAYRVGSSDVVESGILLVGGAETQGTITIDDLSFTFAFEPSLGVPQIRYGDILPKAMTFHVGGTLAFSQAWWFKSLGTLRGKTLSLLCAISEFSSNPNLPKIWKIEYTFYSLPLNPLLSGPAS